MKITVNGEDQQYSESTLSLSDLIDRLQLSGQPVVVEFNGQAVLSKEIPEIKVQDGDKIEFVRIVAGG